MKYKKIRIIYKTFYRDDTTTETIPVITKVIRPIIQVKFLWFWITIKEFLHYNKDIAEEQAAKLYNCLLDKTYIL